jgi:hypothetical protein
VARNLENVGVGLCIPLSHLGDSVYPFDAVIRWSFGSTDEVTLLQYALVQMRITPGFLFHNPLSNC